MTELINEKIPYFGEGKLCCSESSLRLLIERGAVDIPLESVKLMSTLGGGMRCGAPCGAVIGCLAGIGSVVGRYDTDISDEYILETRNRFINRFRERFGHVTCDGLMFGEDKTTVQMQKVCSEIVLEAVDMAAEMIEELKAAQK